MPEESFEGLIRAARQKAYNFAFRLCGNEADASDLMQEAFLQACRSFSSFDGSRPFLPWIFRIIHNLFINRVKSADWRRTVSLDETAGGRDEDGSPGADSFAARDPEPGDALARREQEELLGRALAGLEPHYRAALVPCEIEGWSYEEISLALSCPVGTVKSRIFQGRKKIRALYEELETRSPS